MKRRIYIGAVTLGTIVVFAGLKLFWWGWVFDIDASPDGQHRVEIRQVATNLKSLWHLHDSDLAEGWIILKDVKGKVLRRVYDTQLTFVIVLWKETHVEIKSSGSETYRWILNGQQAAGAYGVPPPAQP